MRYATGVILGALVSGIIFLGSAVIKITGNGVTDPTALNAIWNLFILWSIVSVFLILSPLMLMYYKNRVGFRELLLLEIGSLSFFTPFWFFFATEVSGDPIIDVVTHGVEEGLPYINEVGAITGVNIGPIILIPSLIAMIVFGLFLLRPSYIEKQIAPDEPPELVALKEKTTPPIPESIDTEMPDVKPPESTPSSIEELRTLLVELLVPEETVGAIMVAGFETITDLVATSPNQIASLANIELRLAQEIHLKVQKKVWFGDI
ncbi:MAG: hypothetical protein ACTSUO_04055 [Candidatus Thorarchaeota archaeon]